MCFTYGQWLHMKITTNAGAFFKSLRETVFPLVSGSPKSGARVPSGNIVELTATMTKICCSQCGLSMRKELGGRAGGSSYQRTAERCPSLSHSQICMAWSMHHHNCVQVPPSL